MYALKMVAIQNGNSAKSFFYKKSAFLKNKMSFINFAPPLTKWLSGALFERSVLQKSDNLERNTQVVRNSYKFRIVKLPEVKE